MTPDQIREKLTERRESLVNDRICMHQAWKQRDAEFGARIEEVDFALALAGEETAAVTSAPAEKAAPEKAPRDLCAEILAGIDLDLATDPEHIAASLRARGHNFNMRTIRAALNIVHARRIKESRAVLRPEASDAQTDRSSQRTSEAATPASDGAGADPGPMPAFLVRGKNGEAHAD